MILVEVSVPSINGQYDFRLDENAYIADIITEMGNIIFNTDVVDNTKLVENLVLCDYSTERMFSMGMTLRDYDIHSGARLTLI